jgi:magnesium-transporting ATPase (P-type)
VPFVAAWLSTLLLTIFCISEFWGQTPEMVILFGQVLILGVAGLAIYCLYKLEAPHHWEARDYKQSLAKAAKFRNKRDTRMALFLVLTSSAINIVIIKEQSFTTMLFTFLLAMYLVWASAMVTVAYIVSAEPPPPESGDLKFLPQAA